MMYIRYPLSLRQVEDLFSSAAFMLEHTLFAVHTPASNALGPSPFPFGCPWRDSNARAWELLTEPSLPCGPMMSKTPWITSWPGKGEQLRGKEDWFARGAEELGQAALALAIRREGLRHNPPALGAVDS
jgi:hypothetical protein